MLFFCAKKKITNKHIFADPPCQHTCPARRAQGMLGSIGAVRSAATSSLGPKAEWSVSLVQVGVDVWNLSWVALFDVLWTSADTDPWNWII